MKISDLSASEYNPYYKTYIDKVSSSGTLEGNLIRGGEQIVEFFRGIPIDSLEFRYAEGKWTIKEVFQHIIDTERVFAHRCFRIARHDSTPLAGFEQDDYIIPSKANLKPINDLLEEYQAVRKNTTMLIKSLSNEDLEFIGSANGGNLSARAAIFIILGHEIHHVNVVRERYL